MTAGRDILRGENSRLNVFAKEVFVRSPASLHRASVTALLHTHFLAFDAGAASRWMAVPMLRSLRWNL